MFGSRIKLLWLWGEGCGFESVTPIRGKWMHLVYWAGTPAWRGSLLTFTMRVNNSVLERHTFTSFPGESPSTLMASGLSHCCWLPPKATTDPGVYKCKFPRRSCIVCRAGQISELLWFILCWNVAGPEPSYMFWGIFRHENSHYLAHFCQTRHPVTNRWKQVWGCANLTELTFLQQEVQESSDRQRPAVGVPSRCCNHPLYPLPLVCFKVSWHITFFNLLLQNQETASMLGPGMWGNLNLFPDHGHLYLVPE